MDSAVTNSRSSAPKRRPLRRVVILTVFLASLPVSRGLLPKHGVRQMRNHFHATRTSRFWMSSREQDRPVHNRNQHPQSEVNLGPDCQDGGSLMGTPFGNNKESEESRPWWSGLSQQLETLPAGKRFKMPPIQVDDPNLLFYDVFLLLNLVVSISFWVVHRMQLDYIALAFNEGCLLSILWITSGVYHGAFLGSAVDGHQRPTSQVEPGSGTHEPTKSWWDVPTKGGPPAAGLLALNTFINTINLRLIVALIAAIAQHRPVFEDSLEQLIPLEVGFGLVLMSVWRTVHSAFTPRI